MARHGEATWYVVADGGKARILTRDEAGAMTTISAFDSQGHGDTHEDDASAIRHIHSPGADPRGQVKALFARQVAEHVNTAVAANRVAHVVLAAPGTILHEIREALSKAATATLTTSLSKDLTNIADAELGAHFD